MLNRQELADRLQKFDVQAIAQAAQVSARTIYRLRNMEHAPNWATVESILAAMDKLSKQKPRKAA
jgi:DNA-binding phage protein